MLEGRRIYKRERTRVRQACDRCRIKKAKCDGKFPCSSCEEKQAVCDFKRVTTTKTKALSQQESYLLNMQQSRLIAGIQDMYERLVACGRWEGPRLEKTAQGVYSVNEILVGLGILPTDLPVGAWKRKNPGFRMEFIDYEAGDQQSPGSESLSTTVSSQDRESESGRTHSVSSIDFVSASLPNFPEPPPLIHHDSWDLPLEDYSEVDCLIDADLMCSLSSDDLEISSEQVAQYFFNLS